MSTPSTRHAASTSTRRVRRSIAAVVLVAGALFAGVVAVGGAEPAPSRSPATVDDSVYRQAIDAGEVPAPPADTEDDLMQRLVDEGLIPPETLE